jgi:predicted DNA-binding ribbon-helix-helix protein
MSPTVFIEGEYRFFFFSREELRIHVHVSCSRGEAKFWLEPIIALAENSGLNVRELKKIEKMIEERQNEIKNRWKKHFQR